MSLTVVLWMDLREKAHELSAGWPGLLSWDLLPGPEIWLPCVEPWDLCAFFVGGGSLCRVA